MTLPLWGTLEKAQDDPTTIDEAIQTAITEHEADPTAHQGEGESLEAHKSEEVIDHPAQSIVVDKQQFGFYDEDSSPLGGFGWDPDVGTITGAGTRNLLFSLFSQTDVTTTERLPWELTTDYPDADLVLRFRLNMNGAQNADGSARLAFIDVSGEATDGRIEFVKDGTSYYYRLFYDDVEVAEYELQSGGEMTKFIAVVVDSVNENVQLHVDGVLVDTYETANWKDFIQSDVLAEGTRTTNTSIELGVAFWGARYTLY